MAIERTIGVGGNYADIGIANAAIYAYYAPARVMTDDWILTIISDFTENTGCDANYVYYDGHYIEIRNPNKYVCTVAVVGGVPKLLRFYSRTVFPASAINDKMYFNDLIFNIPTINPGGGALFLGFFPGNQFTYATAFYNNCVFICGGYAPSPAARTSSLIGLEGSASQQWSNASISNCKFYNYGVAIGSSRIGADQIVTIENCTVYDCYNGFNHDVAIPATVDYNVRNLVVAGSENADYSSISATLANINFINCADSDNTLNTAGGDLTDCVHNIVPADEFDSLDPANARFLFLKIGAVTADWTREPAGNVNVGDVIKFDPEVTITPGATVLNDSGIAPTLEAVDITGQLIPNSQGEYPIGCHVQEYST